MGLPASVGDVRFYEGDAVPIRVEIRPQTAPFDLSGSEFTVTVGGDVLAEGVTVEEAVDEDDVVVGVDVVVALTAEQQRALRRLTSFEVEEAGRWGQTLVTARLLKLPEGSAGSASSGSPVVTVNVTEDEVVRVQVVETGLSQTAVNAAADTRIALQKAAANGLATLGADSKIPSAQLPSLAIGEVFTVASQAAMLALTAQRGDVAVRTDLDPDGFFLLTTDSPTVLADWVQVTAPGAVTSVNGSTGAVTLPSDGPAGTASLRTLGTGATQAAAGADLVAEAEAREDADDALTLAIGTKVPLAGGTMTGPLVLPGDATLALHATPLQQVQALIAALVDSSPAALDTLNELAAALGDDANFGATVTTALATKTPATQVRAALAAQPDLLIVGAITRDADGAATSAAVEWPDGTPGLYTGTPSTAFPGAVDSYSVTYGSPATATYTQPAVTRDSDGAVTVRPAMEVS